MNGLVVTVLVDGVEKLSRQYDPRWIDGLPYGLNMGLVGVGSDNSRGTFDNFAVQVLPPQTSFDGTDDFADGVADLFTAASAGTWSVVGGRYTGTPSGSAAATSIMTPARARRPAARRSRSRRWSSSRAAAAAASSSTTTATATSST